MEMKITKEWLLKNAERDKDLEVTAGFLSNAKLDAVYGGQKQPEGEQLEDIESRLAALAQLVNTRRRIEGWTLEQLADKADVDLHDLFCLERCVPVHLNVRTIHKLSGVLKLPHSGLLRLCGATVQRNDNFTEQALRFVARSQTETKPSRQEIKVFEEYVKFLAEEQGK
jgi:HTH-type transcriptional regulator, competence development regulator